MLPSSGNVPARTDLVRSPTDVFLERDCFCLIQIHINGVFNSAGKIKSICNIQQVPPGCMKNNMVSARAVDTTDSASAVDAHDLAKNLDARDNTLPIRHNPVENPNPVALIKDEYRPCFFKCHDKFAKMPERVAQFDDEKLYVTAKGVKRHEIVDHNEIESIENTEEVVEEMEEGSDDESGFFPGSQDRFCIEENDRFGKKTPRPGAARQSFKVAVPAEFNDDLATPATGPYEIKRKYQEKLIKLMMKALHAGLLFYRFNFLQLPRVSAR